MHHGLFNLQYDQFNLRFSEHCTAVLIIVKCREGSEKGGLKEGGTYTLQDMVICRVQGRNTEDRSLLK